jgi:hypothetical protein
MALWVETSQIRSSFFGNDAAWVRKMRSLFTACSQAATGLSRPRSLPTTDDPILTFVSNAQNDTIR